jgi:gliding motility-associated-like protein
VKDLSLSRLLLTIILFSLGASAFATHNRAGEITYRHLTGLTYEIKIVTCTKTSVIADREWLHINWGDIIGEDLDSIQRDSIQFFPDIDAQRNVYIGTHTYAGPGLYELSVLDPNRNEGILNIDDSVNIPFCIVSELLISPETGHNNSVVLLNPPKEQACLNKFWIHNPGAYDPDGDLITYQLIRPRGIDCEFIPWETDNQAGYSYPDDATTSPDDIFYVDPVTGDVVWDVPTQPGEFNVAILIEEWRDINGTLIKVGSVVRDMQITVIICSNDPPEIEELPDYCILIDNTLSFNVDWSDPNGDPVNAAAFGGPLTEVENPAFFNIVSGAFFWTPRCEEVRLQPYQVHFKVTDNSSQIDLTDIETVNIRVIAPAVENPTAEPDGNSIDLSWDAHYCIDDFQENDAFKDFNYKIYRRNGEYGFEPDECETGVPEYTGYELIGSVDGLDNTTYTDSLNVFYGGYYCYMVVTCWPDGAESIASEEFCAEIIKDVPVLTNVSVVTTDLTNGSDSIVWSKPSDLDTLNFSGPYQYKLYWSPGYFSALQEIWESPVSATLYQTDTIYFHEGINTADTANTYWVEFFSGGERVSWSSTASSVFIEMVPDDNELTVVINHEVSWLNESYEIYRQNDLGDFELIGTTTERTYVDTGLLNNVEYCYRVRSVGTYNANGVIDPLLNWSQEACAKPFDLTAPCPPELVIFDDCVEEIDELDWSNPNNVCTDDVVQYNLYYTPVMGGEYEIIESFFDDSDTSFVFNFDGELGTIAGCFYVTALDSLLPGIDGELVQNESEPSNIICIDNCPEYSLPNVFSPNQDGWNDNYQPFPYKFVDSVDFKVFNRWGTVVFESQDPDIGWDGMHKDTGEPVTDGTYYYTATVNTIRLEGIVPIKLSGHIQVFDNKKSFSE